MLGFRSNPPADLSAAKTPQLISALAARGFEVTLAGMTAELDARAERAELLAATFALRLREAAEQEAADRRGREVSETLRQLGQIAGEEFPRAVAQIGVLSDENSELRARARRSEGEAQLLAEALIGGEVRALEQGDDDERTEE
jgi:hypothetical protein